MSWLVLKALKIHVFVHPTVVSSGNPSNIRMNLTYIDRN